MDNADRILRIIYREMSWSPMINEKLISKEHLINLLDVKFQERFADEYERIYPNEYNREQIIALLAQQIQIIKNEYNLDNPIDPIWLFVYYSKAIFHIVNSELVCKFDELFNWEGFRGKIDSLVFEGAFLAQTELSSVECGQIVKHNNDRIYKILNKGIYDNHMHLYGSGYTWEYNWHNISVGELTSIGKLILKNKDQTRVDLELRETRMIKLRILKMYLFAKSFDYVECDDISIIQILNYQESIELINYANNFVDKMLKEYNTKLNSIGHTYQKEFIMERMLFQNLFKKLINRKLNSSDCYAFNAYISAISNAKFEFIQDNIGRGFNKFKHKESIKDLYLPKEKKIDVLKSVFDKYYSEKCVKGIEIRVSLKDKSGLIKLVNQLNSANDEVYEEYKKLDETIEKIKYTVICHAIKTNKVASLNESRYSAARLNADKDLKTITKLFENAQDMNLGETLYKTIGGIDAANYEISCPPEIYAPIFRKRKNAIAKIAPLHFTYHVGEDFVSLASGLRAINDVLEFMNFSYGDRLGHAIALGTDVECYLRVCRNYVISPLQDYIDDLAFMYEQINKSTIDNKIKLMYFLEKEYLKYISKLFKNCDVEPPSIVEYISSYYLRGDHYRHYKDATNVCYSSIHNDDFNVNSKEWQNAFKIDIAKKLYYLYLYDNSIRSNGEEIISIKPETTYIEALKATQLLLHNKIHDIGVIIEVNPSSNKKIGPFKKYYDLPMLNFNSFNLNIPQSTDGKKNIEICINTDDSAIFQTNLSMEYSFIAKALIEEKIDKEEVYNYLDYLRDLSIKISFIKQ